MRIACDNCQTGYDVDPSILGTEGREVRCSSCKTTWFAKPETAPIEPMDDIIDITPDDGGEMLHDGMHTPPPAPKGSKLSKILRTLLGKPPHADDDVIGTTTKAANKSALSKRQLDLLDNLPQARMRRNLSIFGVGALSSAFVAGLIFSDNIVRAVPDLASLYQAVGLEVNVQNLEITHVTSEVRQMDGKPTLVVAGQLHNISSKLVNVPNIQVSLLSDDESELYAWAVQPQTTQLAKGDTIEFETHLVTPPNEAMAVELVFEKPKS